MPPQQNQGQGAESQVAPALSGSELAVPKPEVRLLSAQEIEQLRAARAESQSKQGPEVSADAAKAPEAVTTNTNALPQEAMPHIQQNPIVAEAVGTIDPVKAVDGLDPILNKGPYAYKDAFVRVQEGYFKQLGIKVDDTEQKLAA